MSEELVARREHVENSIRGIIGSLDESIKALHIEMLATDPSENLDELQQVERLEGFHDYLVLSEVAKIEHPTLEDFDKYKLDHPEALLSFGSGEHREPLESDEVQVDDTVSDESLEDKNGEEEYELEVASATNEGMPPKPLSSPEIVPQAPVEDTQVDDDLASAGWVKKDEDSDAPQLDEDPAPADNVVVEDEPEKDSSESEERVPGRIDAKAVSEKNFERKRGGYSEDDVDKTLDGVIKFLDSDHSVEEYEAQINELMAIKFSKPIFAQGFNPSEVDGFISAIIAELKNRSATTAK